MRALTIHGSVDHEGWLSARVPAAIPPGEHEFLLLANLPVPPEKTRAMMAAFPVLSVGAWGQNPSLSREALYGSDGR